MTKYRKSNGDYIEKSTIDESIRRAKEKKLKQLFEMQGYISCQEVLSETPHAKVICDRSTGYIDCSHDISVKACQDSGNTELAWSLDNITIRCREHHRKHDKL